nr:putative lysine decarboxylase [uncultured bacterium]
MTQRISVFGTARSREGDADYEEARLMGRLLAEAGYEVCTGGYRGAMEAVSRGAHEAGGHVVGITVEPWSGWLTPNQYLKEEIATANLFNRLERLVDCSVLVAMHGGAGTLAEVALAWNLMQLGDIQARALVLVGPAWRQLLDTFADTLIVNEQDMALLHYAETPAAVMAMLPTLLETPPQQGYRSNYPLIRG